MFQTARQGRVSATSAQAQTQLVLGAASIAADSGRMLTRTSTGPAEPHRRRATSAPAASAAQHKKLTILFADISGSTALSRTVELDEWWSVLTDAYELMCEAVCRFGGWVGNFTGDGVQGVFETPGRDGEHARGACDAAIWLRGSLHRFATELGRHRGLELDVRIGINSGEAITGRIGDRYSRHYTACGFPVALAKRMETLAAPGEIYLSEHTAALIVEQLEVRALGSFEVKGARSPVGVFELMGPKTTRGQQLDPIGLDRQALVRA
jgi:class 3 adenylate cyclase